MSDASTDKLIETRCKSTEDATLAKNIAKEVRSQQEKNKNNMPISFSISVGAQIYCVLTFDSCLYVSDVHVKQLYGLSTRIRDIRVCISKQLLRVSFWCAKERIHDAVCYAEVVNPKRRRIEYDWEASNITDKEDKDLIAKVIAHVYNIEKIIPNILLSVESIYEKHDDTSKRVRVGFRVCFENMPDFSCAFFQHMIDSIGSRVARQFLVSRPSSSMLYVIHVPKNNTSASSGNVSTLLDTPPPQNVCSA